MYIEPEVLIISNKFDFSTDLITNKLREFNINYLRLNRDELGEYKIQFDPFIPCLIAEIDNTIYRITEEKLISLYYRAPTFLRDIFQNDLSEEEQLYRTQWAAFVRSLVVFENINWVNNPIATYKAEMKPYQLFYAKKIGFKVPDTLIANHTYNINNTSNKIAIKSIDTAILSSGDSEAFIYTTILNEIPHEKYDSPFFIQQGLVPKVDIRITVVDGVIVPVKIKSKEGIDIDWRKYKGDIIYEIFDLPDEIKGYCIELANGLDLKFCAIDMVEYLGEYYFIEVNPTGEWAWLQKNTGYEFDALISKALLS